jgi:pyrroloquinoline-quinone synthase
MDIDHMRSVVLDAVGDRFLLKHPFYQRWEAGELAPFELARYAEQYRHIEAALPGVLETIGERLPPGGPRDLVERNLAEERGVPVAHLSMFEDFAGSVGARPETVEGSAAARLVAMQCRSASTSPASGIATLAAYECQASDIALSKAEGLRRHYGMDAIGTRFWDVHGVLEARHADWSLDVLVQLGAPQSDVAGAVSASAQAWWDFLDERESAAAAA